MLIVTLVKFAAFLNLWYTQNLEVWNRGAENVRTHEQGSGEILADGGEIFKN